MASADYFLKIDGIQGESADSKHKGEIDVLSWTWSASQPASMHSGGGGGAGKVTVSDLTFNKHYSKSSPKLFLACATGEHIKQAVLVARKAGKEQQEYLKITMHDLLVSSYNDSAASETPMESVSLNFAKVEIEYKEQKADGSLGGVVKVGYDMKQNKAV